MKTKTTALLMILLLLATNVLISGDRSYRVDKNKASVKLTEDNSFVVPSSFYTGPGIILESETTYGSDYVIGPEIQVLNGYYDWQTNGQNMHSNAWVSNSIMHAMYMVATDSLDLSASRRTKYAFSADGGATWTDLGIVPNIRSGFPSMTVGNTGQSNQVAIIGNHYQPGAQLTSGVHVDLSPGIGVFTSTLWNFNTTNFIWPNVSTFSNGNVLIAAETYQGAAATDSGVAAIFNPNTSAWVGNPKLFRTTATDHLNMRFIGAAGPGGRGIYILDPITDAGGSFGGNRIFYYTTTDNGASWSNQNLLYDTFIDPQGDTSTAWLGLDVVYDNAGNFYVTWNTIASLFTSAKIWCSKNGGTPVMVAHNLQIPGAASSIVSMGNLITMDWPAISVSSDGQYVFVAYTVCKQADTVNTFAAEDVYYSFSQTSTLNFSGNGPIQVTSGTNDERYVSLNRVALVETGNTYVLHMSYMKDPQPGSCAFNDNAPVSKNHLIYRKITQAHIIGIQNIGNEIPKQYQLLQNFPNPFNPSTKIRFALPDVSKVTLKVYDIVGREVKTLVDKELTAGLKEIEFDASELPSGVYFYNIKAGSFTETKKMVLVK